MVTLHTGDVVMNQEKAQICHVKFGKCPDSHLPNLPLKPQRTSVTSRKCLTL